MPSYGTAYLSDDDDDSDSEEQLSQTVDNNASRFGPYDDPHQGGSKVQSSGINVYDAARHFHSLSEDVVDSVTEWIPSMRDEIEDINETMIQLQLRKEHLESSLPYAESLVAPIRRLAPELVLNIIGK